MKPHQLKQVGISFICALSLGAFIFLNSSGSGKKSSNSFGIQPKLEKEINTNDDEQDLGKKTERSFLPDVEAAKHLFQLMKKFLPAS